jgi:hypothetical protein
MRTAVEFSTGIAVANGILLYITAVDTSITLSRPSTNMGGEGAEVKVKAKFTLEQATKSQRGSRGSSTLSLISALDGVDCQGHAPTDLPRENPGTLCVGGWMGGNQGRSGRVRKISPPPGFDLRTVQPVASRYTD